MVPEGHKGSFAIEPNEHDSDRKVRLFKEVTTFVVILGVLLAVLAGTLYALTRPTATADEKRWLQSVATLIIGGFIGFFLKK